MMTILIIMLLPLLWKIWPPIPGPWLKLWLSIQFSLGNRCGPVVFMYYVIYQWRYYLWYLQSCVHGPWYRYCCIISVPYRLPKRPMNESVRFIPPYHPHPRHHYDPHNNNYYYKTAATAPTTLIMTRNCFTMKVIITIRRIMDFFELDVVFVQIMVYTKIGSTIRLVGNHTRTRKYTRNDMVRIAQPMLIMVGTKWFKDIWNILSSDI